MTTAICSGVARRARGTLTARCRVRAAARALAHDGIGESAGVQDGATH